MGLFVTASYTVMTVLSNKWLKLQSNLEPSGFEFGALSAEELSSRRLGSKFVVIVEQMQIAVMWSCKACLLIMYQRITRTALHKENVAIKILSVYTALGFVVIEILYFAAWCHPFSNYYAVPTSSYQCKALVHHRIIKAVFNISSDLIMLGIALQMLIRSLLPMKRKVVLCGIFSLGLFVVAASIANSYYSFSNPYRPTWIYWYVREASTAILVANLPFTWTILRKFFVLGEFDETNPPPWTYHSSRTAGGRKTAQLLQHQNGVASARAETQRWPHNSNGSKRTQSMTLVGSNSGREHAMIPAGSDKLEETDKGLQKGAIEPHDIGSTGLQNTNHGLVRVELESGFTEDVHQRPVSPDHTYQRNKLASAPSIVTEDGTGGFFMNDRTVPRAHLARTRDSSIASTDRRRTSLASTQASFSQDARRGSTLSSARAGGHIAGGGRSARDRRARHRVYD